MIREKLFRDPIHDLIAFNAADPADRLILRAIDTPEVQRLRRIKQLGMAHMAYQGAEHSRFSHSIGVLHLLRRMLDRLAKQSPKPVDELTLLALQVAGLVHDLGHGPFSHVIEKFFEEHHEVWSRRILLSPETEINRVLRAYSQELPRRVAELLSGEGEPRWLTALIDSQMDADRFDYLMRDSHMTGVKYGVFDLERLLLLLRVSEDGSKVVVDSKGILPVEKYLQSRYQMYRQVYFHKTVTAAEAMLMAVLDRASEVARKGGLPGLREDTPLFQLLTGKQPDIPGFLALDDAVLLSAMNEWSRCADPTLKDLSFSLLNRRLFKSIEIEGGEEQDMIFDTKVTQARDYMDSQGIDYRYYLRFSRSADTPYKPYSSSRSGSTIWIQDTLDPGILRDVKDVSPTVRAFVESPYVIHRAHFPEAAQGIALRKDLTRIFTS